MRFGKPFRGRCVARARHAGKNLPLPHVAALPEGVEDLVETFPVGMSGAEQRAQCRLQRCRTQRCRGCQHLQGVARLGKPDAKAVVAQRAGKAREPAAGAELLSVILRWRPKAALEGCTARAVALRGSLRSHLRGTGRSHEFPHATLPRRRSLTSRVSRARSSWVLSRQIMVS